jgi:hypothetical protein
VFAFAKRFVYTVVMGAGKGKARRAQLNLAYADEMDFADMPPIVREMVSLDTPEFDALRVHAAQVLRLSEKNTSVVAAALIACRGGDYPEPTDKQIRVARQVALMDVDEAADLRAQEHERDLAYKALAHQGADTAEALGPKPSKVEERRW